MFGRSGGRSVVFRLYGVEEPSTQSHTLNPKPKTLTLNLKP